MSEKYALNERIIQGLVLSDADRSSLKTKRGFGDDVIDKAMFRSGGDAISDMAFIKDLDCIEALRQKKIIIPFFNEEGRIHHLRPHHGGIAGLPSEVYAPWFMGKEMFDKPERLVIAEGEFKAVASCVMGVPAISVPGISSFGKTKFEDLLKVIREISPASVVICFDKEVKDDPRFERYKQDYTKRYDTQLWSMILCIQIKAADIPCSIADMPDEWMVGGKIDIDGFLASGMDHALYQKVIKKSLKIDAYKKMLQGKLPKTHMNYVSRSIDSFFYDGPITQNFKAYFCRKGGKNRQISNFTIKVIYTIQTNDGVVRQCVLLSEYGTSQVFELKAEHMSTKGAFLKKCYEMGDFEFFGTEDDLRFLWSYIFLKQTGRIVFQLDYFGFHQETGNWFFENGAYNNDTGEFTPVDENGITWIGETGYHIAPQNISGLKPPRVYETAVDIDLKDLLFHMQTAINGAEGDQTEQGKHARIALGWAVSCIFMPEIIRDYENFPFLFVYGRSRSGKTTLVSWINAMFGIKLEKGVPFSSSTVGLQLASGKLSMIPLWLEEYRNDAKSVVKNELLRNFYDKNTALKGTAVQGRIRQYPTRSAIMLSGEEFPNDSALNSRCITIPLFKQGAKSDSYFWMQENKKHFVGVMAKILKNKKNLWPKIKEEIDASAAALQRENLSNRIIDHSAILNGVSTVLFGSDEDFNKFVKLYSRDIERSRDNEMSINVFYEDLAMLLLNNQVKNTFAKTVREGTGDFLYLHSKSAYSIWESFKKRDREDVPMKYEVIRKWIVTSDYCVSPRASFRSGQIIVTGLKIDVSHKSVTPALTEFASIVRQKGFDLGNDDEGEGPLDMFAFDKTGDEA